MGRKSLATERGNQILDAFEQCIVTHGLDGATLQRTAEAATVNLGMIHHYIGTRDELLRAMVTRLGERAKSEVANLVKMVPAGMRLPILISEFFDDESDSQTSKVIDELFAASGRQETVRELLQEINQVYVDIWAEEIGRQHPTLPDKKRQDIAFSVLSLAYGCGLLMPLGFDKARRRAARVSAENLIANP